MDKQELLQQICKTIREYKDPSNKSLYITQRIGLDLAEHLLTSLRKQDIIIVPPGKGDIHEIVKNIFGKEE